MYQRFRELEMPLAGDSPVAMKDFRQKFDKIKDLTVFKWLFVIFRGYENKNLNYEETSQKIKNEDRRLTVASVERTKSRL